jgi:23S rRNA (cytidine1920-2'-O)/16S rRNA (cytidine1409-2'-O)-methyltransferase
VGKEKIGKNGVVRSPQDQADAIWQVLVAARELGWRDRGLTYSPLVGPAGNIEYLLWLSVPDPENLLTRAPVAISRASLHDLTRQAQAELT